MPSCIISSHTRDGANWSHLQLNESDDNRPPITVFFFLFLLPPSSRGCADALLCSKLKIDRRQTAALREKISLQWRRGGWCSWREARPILSWELLPRWREDIMPKHYSDVNILTFPYRSWRPCWLSVFVSRDVCPFVSILLAFSAACGWAWAALMTAIDFRRIHE